MISDKSSTIITLLKMKQDIYSLGGIVLDYKQFFEQIKGKKIAMCGIGISNTPLIMSFLEMGAKVYACDRRTRDMIGDIAQELEKAGAELKLGDGYLDNLEVDINSASEGSELVVEYSDNTISILKSDYNRVVIYLNDSIMDLSKPVTVEYNGNTIFHGKVKRTSQVIANSISLFQDPCYIYSAKVEVTK